jgi:hypothetical protein
MEVKTQDVAFCAMTLCSPSGGKNIATYLRSHSGDGRVSLREDSATY